MTAIPQRGRQGRPLGPLTGVRVTESPAAASELLALAGRVRYNAAKSKRRGNT